MAVRVQPVSLVSRSLRQLGSVGRGVSRPDAFQSILQAVQSAPATPPARVYVVQKGDTLSGICAKALTQRGSVASVKSVTDSVQSVAAANGIANPDRIQVGQQIDLAPLTTSTASARASLDRSADDLTVLIKSLIATPAAPVAKAAAPAPKAAVVAAQSQPWSSMLEGKAMLSSEFGTRKDPFTGTLAQHNGIDLAADPGTQVHPYLPGKVVFSGWQPEYGKVVIVQHAGGAQTIYAHNAQNLVKAGQSVTTKSQIAKVGSTGRSTGPHLHFEVREGGQAVDPLPFLKQPLLQVAQAS